MSRPDVLPGVPYVAEVEALVRRAIDERRPDLLTVVGHGEFSLAVSWTDGDREWVVKRVPPFRNRDLAARYEAATREYISAFEARGVPCVATQLVPLERPDGSVVVYHCQPHLETHQLVSEVLRRTAPRRGNDAVEELVGAIGRVVGDHFALDPQCSNWYWYDQRAWHLDFSTPLLLGDSQAVQFDLEPFLRAYPVVVRPFVALEFHKTVPNYTQLDHVLTNLVAQLNRDDLVAWTDAFVDAARRQYGIELSVEAAWAVFRANRNTYPWLHRLKRARRFWTQHTGRTYDILLPASSSFTN